jgi:hypothetical protein
MNARRRLEKAIVSLDELKIALLAEMAASLTRKVEVTTAAARSDLVCGDFVEDFANRLLLHHATNEERLNKKSFEYLFVASCKAAGRTASRVSLDDNPHADVVVDGVMFSLKTEASASISEGVITVSKLAEARWIRECRTGKDFLSGVRAKIVPHIESYERILTLRSFSVGDRGVRYDLVEIPRELLLKMRNLREEDFAPRTSNNSTKATVTKDGRPAFSLRLDGSVEKVTIANLSVSECITHARWLISLCG